MLYEGKRIVISSRIYNNHQKIIQIISIYTNEYSGFKKDFLAGNQQK